MTTNRGAPSALVLLFAWNGRRPDAGWAIRIACKTGHNRQFWFLGWEKRSLRTHKQPHHTDSVARKWVQKVSVCFIFGDWRLADSGQRMGITKPTGVQSSYPL